MGSGLVAAVPATSWYAVNVFFASPRATGCGSRTLSQVLLPMAQPPWFGVSEYVNWIESPLFTLIAENTLWSHITGRKTSVSVLAGAWPAAPEDVRYQAPTVTTDVVFDNTRPHDWFVPEVRSISVFA